MLIHDGPYVDQKEVAQLDSECNFTGRLKREKEHLEKRLSEINALLDSLNENPEVANIVNAIQRLGHI